MMLPRTCVLVVGAGPDLEDLLDAAFTGRPEFDLQIARDAGSALALLETARPELIIADLELPDGDGWELLRQVRTRSEFALVPFLVLSVGPHWEPERTCGLVLGADTLLRKPCTAEDLLAQTIEVLAHGLAIAERCEDRPGGTACTLTEVGPVPALLLMARMDRRGVATFLSRDRGGQIWLAGGQIVGAEVPSRGFVELEALREIISWEDGYCSFTPEPAVSPGQLEGSAEMLVRAALGMEP